MVEVILFVEYGIGFLKRLIRKEEKLGDDALVTNSPVVDTFCVSS